MKVLRDKYGRGSAAANGADFVDLEPGDTFSGLEAKLRLVQTVIYENRLLGLRASIGSLRNANELSKHMAPREEEEAHKFAAKNVGALFARGTVGIRHLDKKAVPGARWIVTYVRVFSWFVFAGKRKLATITLKENKDLNNFYSVEAVEINEDADSERTPRGAMPEDLNSAPLQNLASQLAARIAYYVGDVNRTRPAFLARSEAFSVEAATKLIAGMAGSSSGKDDGKGLSRLLTIVIPVRNEEKNLPDCLENVKDFKHVLLVDSGSNDRTREIFEGFREQISGRDGEIGQRNLAERKVGEWLSGVSPESFAEALAQLVDEKATLKEYRFKQPEDRESAMAGAQRFFDEFARKIIELSDGRCVYFAPDKRALERNGANRSRCWAEYAFHAVSSSGKILDGCNYRERLFNRSKVDAVEKICEIIRHEHCMYRLIDACPENDAVMFIGCDAKGGRVEVVTRLDEYGNAKTNLGEVTVIVQHKRNKQTPPPKFRPLTEVVETVAKHQAAGFSPSTTTGSIANTSALRKGEQNWERIDFKWDGKFPKKRNWVLRNYTFKTPWALFLDADERMTEEWKREAEALLPSPEANRYDVIKCYYDNWFLGKMLRHGDCMQKTAMVRVGAAEYEKIDEDSWSSLDMEIHEHLQPRRADAEGEIRARMEHHDKRSFESHVAKHREYAKWEAGRYRQLMAHPERWEALSPRQKVKYRNLTKWWLAPAYFAVCYIRKLGFLDGYAGLRFALFKAWYFALVRRTIKGTC